MKVDLLENVRNVFFVGIKGSGVCSLACFLKKKGYYVEGVDISDKFYTDEILDNNKIVYYENIYEFSLKNSSKIFDLLIFSPAYDQNKLQVLLEAKKSNIAIMSYPEVLGKISKKYYSIGIAGSHGKTTTAAFLGILFNALGLNPNVILGSSVKDFNNQSAIVGNSNILIAETCEYRQHFLYFNPNMLILTNIDYEHIDFFKTYDSLEDAFLQYVNNLEKDGILIINSDNKNLVKIQNKVKRSDIKIYSFGLKDISYFQVNNIEFKEEFIYFDFLGLNNIKLRTILLHNVLNFAAALLALDIFLNKDQKSILNFEDVIKPIAKMYKGIKRRFEIIKEKEGIIYIDDYAHHPKEINSTFLGIKNFYKNRRIILDFMPHTFTRTREFFSDFVKTLSIADILILHNIYLSRRENFDPDELSRKLFLSIKRINPNVYFFKKLKESVGFINSLLKEGDLFITMGAGNNFILHDFL